MRRFPILLTVFLVFVISVGAQDDDAGHFILHEVTFDIDGSTGERALARDIEIEEGKAFATEEDLLAYVDDMRQKMVNKRYFDHVDVHTIIAGFDGDDTLYMARYVLADSWTFIPLIYPKYDSNTGFRLSLRLDYDNAFGTMTDWDLSTSFDFGTGEFRINPSISGLDLWGQNFKLSYAQSYVVEEKIESEVTIAEWTYHQSSISIGTGLGLRDPWKYSFTPSFTFRYAYDDVLGAGGFNEESFGFTWNHSGGVSDVNWTNNYRNGYSLSLGHNLSLVNREGSFEVVNKLSLGGSLFYTFNDIVAFYSRMGYDIIFNDEMTGYGSKLRGVSDNSMYGFQGAYANLSLAFQFWRWVGVWDAQVHPFFDIGLADPEDASFDTSEHLKMGAGLDFVLYLDNLKNLVARGTIGYDLTSDLPKTDTGRLEIIISSELHY